VVLAHTGAPEVMHVVEEDELPEPGAGQARVKVLAAGVSRSPM
jgi:NADPH:quinone reductase-like Zn-dependent oxidoreductase